MNSHALQKRIIDGKLFLHGPIGEWPANELRNNADRQIDEDLRMAAANALRAEYPETLIPARKIRNWGFNARSRH